MRQYYTCIYSRSYKADAEIIGPATELRYKNSWFGRNYEVTNECLQTLKCDKDDEDDDVVDYDDDDKLKL